MSNMTWNYDDASGRYVVKGARIMFPNFDGAEQEFNPAGRRNFRLLVNEDLADELKSRGLYVRERPPRDETEDTQRMVKIGVYQDADIRLLSGHNMTALELDNFGMIDREFRKGHVGNGEISLEFHVSRNTRVPSGALYARVDTMIVPLRKSRLLEEYEEDMDYEEATF